jgi:hypothetical protein
LFVAGNIIRLSLGKFADKDGQKRLGSNVLEYLLRFRGAERSLQRGFRHRGNLRVVIERMKERFICCAVFLYSPVEKSRGVKGFWIHYFTA